MEFEDWLNFQINFRGISDNYLGFVYSPNGQKLSGSDFGGDLKEIKKFDENWYWVGSY